MDMDGFSSHIQESPLRFTDRAPLIWHFARTLELLVHIQAHWDDQLIASTLGVHTILGTAWVVFLDLRDTDGLRYFGQIVYEDSPTEDSPWMEEYSDGVGGTPAHLAFTTLRYINYALETQPMPAANVFILAVAAKFIFDTSTASSGSQKTSYETELLAGGLVGALTSAICALNVVVSDHSIGLQVLDNLLSLLGQRMVTPPGYLWIVESLKAGLLRALLSSATSGGGEMILGCLDYIVGTIMPAHLTYRSVLLPLGGALLDVEQLVATKRFRQSNLFKHWEAFTALAHERLELLAEFESSTCTFKACDNIECGRILAKYEFKRYSACLEFYYCSRECQTLDWKAGYRETCKIYRSGRMDGALGGRDLAFLRALVQSDYLGARKELFGKKFMLMNRAPGTPVFTTFDYTEGRVSLRVEELQERPDDLAVRNVAVWRNLASRVSRSSGRLEIHWVVVREGTEARRRIFRMRFDHSQVHDGLVEMLGEWSNRNTDPERATFLSHRGFSHLLDMDVRMAH
ncbi:hypothetical protein FB451DRAFT_1282808 [Mycena latifolia]|nr:hypothetical protein FB451DRAFT_1282808 [Mycena latifolia]